MRFNFNTWTPIYEEHEMFKVNICSAISAMVSIQTGFKTTITWTGLAYGINSNPFVRLPHAPRGLFLLDSGVNQASIMIKTIFHQKLLTY